MIQVTLIQMLFKQPELCQQNEEAKVGSYFMLELYAVTAAFDK